MRRAERKLQSENEGAESSYRLDAGESGPCVIRTIAIGAMIGRLKIMNYMHPPTIRTPF